MLLNVAFAHHAKVLTDRFGPVYLGCSGTCGEGFRDNVSA